MVIVERKRAHNCSLAEIGVHRITVIRTQSEYQATDQYRAHAAAPLIQIDKIRESAPEPLPPAARPLSGVRALGMTHVVAGPTVLRQLAAAGADCLNLNQPGWYVRRVHTPRLTGRDVEDARVLGGPDDRARRGQQTRLVAAPIMRS